MPKQTTVGQESVLFLHGLESGPRGRKAQQLKKAFPNTLCPDLDMSLYRLDKSNSLSRSLIYVLATQPSIVFAGIQSMMTAAASQSLSGCAELAKDTVNDSQTKIDVVCGSSWGGAVALWMMLAGEWNGPTVLIAPALKRSLTYGLTYPASTETMRDTYVKLRDRIANPDQVIVIHGDNDDTVALDDSRELCEAVGFQLVVVEGGDHRLNQHMSSGNKLISYIKLALQPKL